MRCASSQGSFDNLHALKDPSSDVQAGIVQGGLANSIDAPNLFSMGRLLTEPVWIFYRGPDKLDHITQLKGKRILIGPKGSGTTFLALKLLEANGVTAENSTLIPMELPAYLEAFERGSADAGFLVLGAEARTVQRLLHQPGTSLMNMAQADAAHSALSLPHRRDTSARRCRLRAKHTVIRYGSCRHEGDASRT